MLLLKYESENEAGNREDRKLRLKRLEIKLATTQIDSKFRFCIT